MFKVGDEVIILPRKPGQEFQSPIYMLQMMRYAGNRAIVAEDKIYGSYVRLKGIPDYMWHPDWLGDVPKVLESAKDMEALYD